MRSGKAELEGRYVVNSHASPTRRIPQVGTVSLKDFGHQQRIGSSISRIPNP